MSGFRIPNTHFPLIKFLKHRLLFQNTSKCCYHISCYQSYVQFTQTQSQKTFSSEYSFIEGFFWIVEELNRGSGTMRLFVHKVNKHSPFMTCECHCFSWPTISDVEDRELWKKLMHSCLGVENHSISNISPVLRNFTYQKPLVRSEGLAPRHFRDLNLLLNAMQNSFAYKFPLQQNALCFPCS